MGTFSELQTPTFSCQCVRSLFKTVRGCTHTYIWDPECGDPTLELFQGFPFSRALEAEQVAGEWTGRRPKYGSHSAMNITGNAIDLFSCAWPVGRDCLFRNARPLVDLPL